MKISENLSEPMKSTSWRPAYSSALYQITVAYPEIFDRGCVSRLSQS